MDTTFQKMAVFMIDGFDMEYYEKTDMRAMKRMARQGFFKPGSAIFPSLTNANNISIACGCWPSEHGVTTNSYFDGKTGEAYFLEDSSFLTTKTLFDRLTARNIGSALLTCKAKTAKILGQRATLSVAAEAPDEWVVEKYGSPPPMYSSEINYWLFDIGLDLIKTRDDLGLIYLHTTDYPMHMWPPEAEESQRHLLSLDSYFAKFHQLAPDYALAITADHGMNKKIRCWDLEKACHNRGGAIRHSVSPVADRLVRHHGGHGGVSYVYLNHVDDGKKIISILMDLQGVEQVLERKEAARRFSLVPSRIGDLVVIPDRDTVFGNLEEECEILPGNYRSHGSLYEMDVPLLMFNLQGQSPSYRDINYNLDLTRYFIEMNSLN